MITPAPGWMVDPNNPNGVIPIGSQGSINNPNAALIAGGTSGAAAAQANGTQPSVPSTAFGAVTQNYTPPPAPVYVPPKALAAPGYTAPAPSPVAGAITVGSTTDPTMDKVQQSMVDLANKIISSGYTIPDTLKITPDLVSKFLGWAHQVVDPQTQQLLSSKIADVNASLKNLDTQFQQSQGQLLQDFGTSLATEQNTSGANGVAFSGQRALNERNLAATTNRSLASLGANTEYNIGSTLRSGAADVGSANSGGFQLPNLSLSSVSNDGGSRGSYAPSRSLDFGYNPSLYTASNIATSQNDKLNSQQANYLQQYGTLAATNSNGSRTVNDLFGLMSGLPANR